MDPLSAAVLGLVQALTEFLPVSSSGHLVLGKTLLHLSPPGGAAFEVAVHFGTLLSVVVLFRQDIAALLTASFELLIAPRDLPARWRDDERLRLIAAIVVGAVPAGLVGVAFKDQLEQAFDSPLLVCGALVVTGVILLTTRFVAAGARTVDLPRAVAIGIAQALAIIPGVSRSGSTIACAMLLGVERVTAARYSFLLSLPVILGATLLKIRDVATGAFDTQFLISLGLGAAVSFVVGLFALWLLMQVVRRGHFAHFSWYCFAVGGVGLALL